MTTAAAYECDQHQWDNGVGVGRRLTDDFDEHNVRFQTLRQLLIALRSVDQDCTVAFVISCSDDNSLDAHRRFDTAFPEGEDEDGAPALPTAEWDNGVGVASRITCEMWAAASTRCFPRGRVRTVHLHFRRPGYALEVVQEVLEEVAEDEQELAVIYLKQTHGTYWTLNNKLSLSISLL